jgi:hypothetical protein
LADPAVAEDSDDAEAVTLAAAALLDRAGVGEDAAKDDAVDGLELGDVGGIPQPVSAIAQTKPATVAPRRVMAGKENSSSI